jgi:hypothetical protein
LTSRLFDEGLGREELAELLSVRNREIVSNLCGPRYHPIDGCRYMRAGTKMRMLGTRFGIVKVRVGRVYDRMTDRTIIPLWDDIRIVPRRIFQDDVNAILEHSVIRMTYRNTAEEMAQTISRVPCPATLNRRVIEDGAMMAGEINARKLTATTLQPDGTKLYSQGGGHDDLNIILATGQGKAPMLRSITVGQPWKCHIPAIRNTNFVDDKGRPCLPNSVSDMEPGLRELMTVDGGHWQPCVVHVIRYAGIALWQDDLQSGPLKRKIVGQVKRILHHLKASLDKHLPRGEKDAITHRIAQTAKEFRRLATRISVMGMRRTVRFLREMSNVVTTYAALALQGITIPDTNNRLERLMGEVSKRCKHKWMSWTSKGALALLTMLVVRTVEPATYQAFWNRKLYGEACPSCDRGVRITRLEREF